MLLHIAIVEMLPPSMKVEQPPSSETAPPALRKKKSGLRGKAGTVNSVSWSNSIGTSCKLRYGA